MSVHVWLFDQKDDSKYLAVMYPDFLILDGETSFNPLQIPPWLRRDEVIGLLVRNLAASMYSAQRQRSVLTEALLRAYSMFPVPSLADLKGTVDDLYKKSDTYTRRDAVEGLSQRLAEFQTYPGIYRTRVGLSLEEICNHSLYLGTRNLAGTDEFLFSTLLYHLYYWRRAQQHRAVLSHVIVLDEGLGLWNTEHDRINGPTLAQLYGLVREWGIGIITTTLGLQLTHPIVRSSAYLQVAMGLTDAKETQEVSRTFGLNPAQVQYLHERLVIPECIVKLGGRWRSPLLATVPPLLPDKAVSATAWTAARQRVSDLLPKGAATIALLSEGLPPQKPSRAETAPIALNRNEQGLLEAIVRDPARPCTFYYKARELHLQAGDRARKKLELLGLIESEPMFVRSGRGGKGIGLRATRKGCDLVGKQPRHGTRGGDSIQHEYLVRSLARALNVNSEASLG